MSDAPQYTDNEGKQQYSILDSLTNDANISPKKAVQQIVDISKSPKTYDRQLGDHCYYTARALVDVAARSTPKQQLKLINFLFELRNTTVTDPSSNEPLKHDGKVVWKDLPTFGYTFADELNSVPGNEEPTKEQSQQWENTVTFFAQLDASTNDSELDFTETWAVAFISRAFGDESAEQSESMIRLACVWYIRDVAKIWDRVASDSTEITKEKWDKWKQGVEKAQERFRDEHTTNLLEEALLAIDWASN